MRRSQVVIGLFLALRAAPALADPLDLDLEKLGAPTAAVWTEIGSRGYTVNGAPLALAPGDAARLASESRQRFALLATQLGLALSSSILSPASTTGALGYEIDLEAAYASISPDVVGTGLPGLVPATTAFPFRSAPPAGLFMPALHVRKALPMSIELGGRAIYLDRSQLVAAQAELKWAINESYGYFPDLAVRAAFTHLFGQRDLSLDTLDLDLMVGRRFGVGGVMHLTPYGAVRLSWVGASSDRIDFAPNTASGVGYPDNRPPQTALATQAAFPDLKMSEHLFPRLTAGVRLVTGALSLAVEGSYRFERTFTGPAQTDGQYPTFVVPSALSAAGKVGLEF